MTNDLAVGDCSTMPNTLQHWTEVYRDLHAHPELSGQEVRTATILAEALRKSGFEVTERIGGTGVVGVLENGTGPVIALRGDMDALPIEETTDLPWRSRARQIGSDGTLVPTMHACGHDMHVTALLAAAEALSLSRDRWKGTIVIIGQPAEELATGARAMIADGLYTRFPRPDVVLGQHVGPFPVGMVLHADGLLMGAATHLDVTVHGRGGHGALPAETIDPVVIAAHIIVRLQTIASRETDTHDPVVVTVGKIRAGTKSNIIPDCAVLSVDVRARNDETMRRTLAAIERIVTGECEAGATPLPPTIDVKIHAPATRNAPDLVNRLVDAHRALGDTSTVVLSPPVSASEDFPEFGLPSAPADDQIPYAFWFWGGIDPERFSTAHSATPFTSEVPGNHTSNFQLLDTPTIEVGRALLVTAALEFLDRG
jgi:amidohydrolase